jgi:hypothetical protein
MIRYIDSEAILRSMSDECPGILGISRRPEHDYGAFIIDTKWQPPKPSAGRIVRVAANEDPRLEVPPPGEPVPWLTALTAEEVVEELEGAKEVVFLLHMLRVDLHGSVDSDYARMSFATTQALARLADETIVAIRLRWPRDFPA